MSRSKIISYGSDGSKSVRSGEYIPKAELAKIADQIRARIRRTVEDIVETGRDLTRAKASLDHGKFGKWIDREFSMTMRSAQRYIQAAEWAKDKSDTVSHLLPSTVYLLSAKSTPEEIQNEVVSDLKAGRAIEVRQIEDRIRETRREQRIAARDKRRRAKVSPATLRRQEREAERHKAEVQEREDREKEATSEILSILRKLGRADLERLSELFDVIQSWQIQEGLTRALEPLPEKQWEVPSMRKSGAGS